MNDPTFDTVAQSAHVWFGGWIVYTFALWTSAWIGAAAVLLFAAVKEFWYDEKYESVYVRGSGWRDFAFYALGAVATAALLAVIR